MSKKTGKICKKILAVLLALSMTAGMVPETALYAQAAEETMPVEESMPEEETMPAEESMPEEEAAPAKESMPEEETMPAEGSMPEEEAAPAKESVPEEEASDAGKALEGSAEETASAGAFSEVSVTEENCFSIHITGVFTKEADVTDEKIYAVQYDAAGTLIDEFQLYSYSRGDDQISFSGYAIPLQQKTVKVVLKAAGILDGSEVFTEEEAYTRENTPSFIFEAGELKAGSHSVFASCTLKDTENAGSGGVHFWEVLCYAGEDGEWHAGTGQDYWFYGYNSDPMTLRADNLEAGREYQVKIVVAVLDNGGYPASLPNEEDCVFYQELDLGKIRTAEGIVPGAGFEDLNITFTGFRAEAQGKYEASPDAVAVKMEFVMYDETGEELHPKWDSTSYLYDPDGNVYSLNYVAAYLHADTRFVAIRATESYDNSSGEEETKEFVSERIAWTSRPDLVFRAGETEPGAGSVSIPLFFTGETKQEYDYQSVSFYATLIYTEKGGSAASGSGNKSVSFYVSNNSKGNAGILSFSGLKEGTEYTAVLKISANYNPDYEEVFSQEITIPAFTTKKNETYEVTEIFPDEEFRSLILKKLGNPQSTTVTTADLEGITTLYAGRNDFSTPVIQKIEGVQYLTNLSVLSLGNHEVEDAAAIDWSKCKKLSSLDLTGNELTEIPDLSGNAMLTYLSLNENKIPESEFAKASSKLPAGVTLSSSVKSSQRVGGLQIITEDTYYQTGQKSFLGVRITGYKTGLPYTFRYLVDGEEVSLENTSWQTAGKVYYNMDTGIGLGEHEFTVEMYADSEQVTSKNAAFTMAAGKAYAEKEMYNFSGRAASFSLYLYSDRPWVSAVLQDKKGTIWAADNDISCYNSNSEFRYRKLSENGLYLDGYKVYYAYVGLESLRNKALQAGTYDVVITYQDGTTETLEGLVSITDQAVVTNIYGASDYDNRGEFFYLSLSGEGIDPTKLRYTYTDNGTEREAVYVAAKPVYRGYVVKLKKSAGLSEEMSGSVTMKLSAKPGYDVIFQQDTCSLYMASGLYYYAYNEAAQKLEAGVTSDWQGRELTWKLTRYQSWEDASDENNPIEEFELQTDSQGMITYLTPFRNGAGCALSAGYYRLDVGDGSRSSYGTFSVAGGSSSVNYWSGASPVSAGTKEQWYYYYSDIPYDKAASEKFTASLTGEGLEQPQKVKTEISAYRPSETGELTKISMQPDLSALPVGSYIITAFYDGQTLSSYNVQVVAADKFILTGAPSVHWISEDSFEVYVSTINTSEQDEYVVKLTDIEGKAVEGLKTKVTHRYSRSLYLEVTGLKKEEAYRSYYLRVEHRKLGAPVGMDGISPYYSDERGKFVQFNTSTFSWYGSGSRVIGLGIYKGISYPVTLSVYRPYDADEVAVVQIQKSDLDDASGNPQTYYFRQSLIDALPDKDALYDLVVVSADGMSSTNDGENIGLRSSGQPGWTVSPTALNLDLGSDQQNSGIITLSGNKNAPAFKSANTDVATVKAVSGSKNQATVTAVGKGSTVITVTADGQSRTVTVNVTKEPVKAENFTIRADSSRIAVGTSTAILATVTPAQAWSSESFVTYTSSDSQVAEVSGEAGKNCRVTGIRPGTADITAVLHSADGTEMTASCQVTVEDVFSEQEQQEKLEEIGTLWYLESSGQGAENGDTTLGDIELPDGWRWENPNEAPAADDALPVQKFRAVYEKEGYVSFSTRLPVNVTRLETAGIIGEDNVLMSAEETVSRIYTAQYQYVGSRPASGLVSYEWETPGTENGLSVTGDAAQDDVEVNIAGGGTLELTVTLTNPDTGRKVWVKTEKQIAANHLYIRPAQDQPAGAIPLGEGSGAQVSETVITTDAAAFDKRNSSKIALEAAALGSGEAYAGTVKWSTSDASVMSVDKKGVVTVKKAGIALICAETEGSRADLQIRVENYAPALENKSVTVYRYSSEGTPIGLFAQNGNAIREVTVNGAKGLIAEEDDETGWCLKVEEGDTSYTAKTTANIQLHVVTDREVPGADGTAAPAAYDLPLKVVVDVTRPDQKSVKFKQTVKPNVFYGGDAAENAVFTVSSSKYVIEDIYTDDPAAEQPSSAGGYYVEEYDAAAGRLVLEAENLNKETLSGYDFSPVVYVKVKGYEAVPLTLQVKTQNKKPVLKFGDAVFTDQDRETDVEVYSGKQKVDAAGMIFGSAKSKLEGITLTGNGNGVDISYSGRKSGIYQVSISSDDWTGDVTAQGKITVVDRKKLALEADTVKVTINTNEAYNETVHVAVGIKGNRGIPVVLNASESKQRLTIAEEKDGFEISAPAGTPKGTYKVKITGNVGGTAVKAVTVTVTVTDKAPEVKLSAKGSINLADRAHTGMTYTVTLKNLPVGLVAEDVLLDENSAKYFSAEVENGKVAVRALDAARIHAKQKYPVTMTLILSNGMEVTAKPVNVTPVDKLPKVKVTTVNGKIYKTGEAPNLAVYDLKSGTAGIRLNVLRMSVEQDKKGVFQNFEVDLEEDRIKVSLTNTNLKAGTYNLNCRLIVSEADNSKPVKVKLKVVVK